MHRGLFALRVILIVAHVPDPRLSSSAFGGHAIMKSASATILRLRCIGGSGGANSLSLVKARMVSYVQGRDPTSNPAPLARLLNSASAPIQSP